MKYKKMTMKELRSELAKLRGELFRLEMNEGNIYKQHRLANKIKEIEYIIDSRIGRL